jgi:hypothetical protein
MWGDSSRDGEEGAGLAVEERGSERRGVGGEEDA